MAKWCKDNPDKVKERGEKMRGELLPVYWDISMPGDKYKFNVEYSTRTQPVETSAYTRLREYFGFYAVPLRLLWKSAPSVLTQMQDINQIQALSLTQNLALGTYLPSLPIDYLGIAINQDRKSVV